MYIINVFMDGRTDQLIDWLLNRWTDWWIDGLYVCMDGWINEWMYG